MILSFINIRKLPREALKTSGQTDLGLHYLPRPVCPKTLESYGYNLNVLTKVIVFLTLVLVFQLTDVEGWGWMVF